MQKEHSPFINFPYLQRQNNNIIVYNKKVGEFFITNKKKRENNNNYGIEGRLCNKGQNEIIKI